MVLLAQAAGTAAGVRLAPCKTGLLYPSQFFGRSALEQKASKLARTQ